MVVQVGVIPRINIGVSIGCTAFAPMTEVTYLIAASSAAACVCVK